MKQEVLLEKINNTNIDLLKKKYRIDELLLFRITLTNKREYIVLFVKLDERDSLMARFDNFTSSISVILEKYLKNDFERWNAYILYLVKDNLNKEKKYKIENDTFFARKIVEDNYTLDLSDENIKKLISSHISFDDLDIKGTRPKNEEYTSDSKVYKELSEIDKLDDDKIDTILKSLEKDD